MPFYIWHDCYLIENIEKTERDHYILVYSAHWIDSEPIVLYRTA